jgi:hypothetical protein
VQFHQILHFVLRAAVAAVCAVVAVYTAVSPLRSGTARWVKALWDVDYQKRVGRPSCSVYARPTKANAIENILCIDFAFEQNGGAVLGSQISCKVRGGGDRRSYGPLVRAQSLGHRNNCTIQNNCTIKNNWTFHTTTIIGWPFFAGRFRLVFIARSLQKTEKYKDTI